MRVEPQGGYNVPLAGRPSTQIDDAVPPKRLLLPLASDRLSFTELTVADGDRVEPGQVLARDLDHHNLPLLAPREGTVHLENVPDGHLVLDDLGAGPQPESAAQTAGRTDRTARLVELGAWTYFADAATGDVPDPDVEPQAIIVSTLRLEPFGTRGDALLSEGLDRFARGLEHLQSLLEYQPMYLVVPNVQAELADELHERLRGLAEVDKVTVPIQYPVDHRFVLAEGLGLTRAEAPAWYLRTEGVLAVDQALSQGLPATERMIGLGGPAVASPRHLKLPLGYPLQAIRENELSSDGRLILGGVLTGDAVGEDGPQGLPAECPGLTALPRPRGRELLGWIRPGLDRQSYGSTFLSKLRQRFYERLTTSLRGERRACIACGQCAEVCPVAIMPHLIHKALYAADLDRVEGLAVERCIGCGLCSYVCPSKIELRHQLLEAQETLRAERLEAEEALA